MDKLSKNFLLVIILIIAILGFIYLSQPTANIYIDNNTVSCSITPFYMNNHNLESEICDYVISELDNTHSNISTITGGIRNISNSYDIHLNIKINSKFGENIFPTTYFVDGRSMVPTLEDGQSIIVNKTKDIDVNDIVVANSPKYGVIVKRVSDIKGDNVYLTSDNKNVEYKEINGLVYESRGITTWININDIYGVVISY